MEASKIIDKQIVFEVICALIILSIILVGGSVIYNNVKGGKTYAFDNLMVELKDSGTPTNLHIMSDGTGLKTNPYVYTITNNNRRSVSYNIEFRHNLHNINKVQEYLKICIDDVIIKKLSDFEVDKNGHYILLNEELDAGVTSVHTIKVWLSSNSPNSLSGTPANFNFSVESE